MAFNVFPINGTVYEIWAQNGETLAVVQQLVSDDDEATLAAATAMIAPGEFSPYPGAAICHVEAGVRVVDVQPEA